MFLEGPDDIRFFDRIVRPMLEKKYDYVKIIQHAKTTNKYIHNYVKSIEGMSADYVYVKDINRAPCVTAKKQEIRNELRNINEGVIIVVIKEIESWYLAGVNSKAAKKFGLSPFKTTDDVTKEDFDKMIPKKSNRVDFMLEILKQFSIEIGKQKNMSFKYFVDRYRVDR